MAKTPSTMLELGTHAPDFSLPDTDGNVVSLHQFEKSPALLVLFICNHCPYVIHIRKELAHLTREFLKKGVAVVAINANDVENYPDDSPEKMAVEKKHNGYSFPYLFDADQSVAKAYHAACTPDFFLFDGNRRLVYRGQFDESRPGNGIPVTGKDLKAAVESLLTGQPVGKDQRPSLGCNIKWKPGNEPEYFL
jgi:peroxiredoxin